MADRWTTRDLPVLLQLAKPLDDGEPPTMSAVGDALGLDEATVRRSVNALVDAGYLREEEATISGRSLSWGGLKWLALTERGRRGAGLWPSGEGVDALVDALRQAEETTTDPEEKTLIRKAASAVLSVSRDVMVDVTAAVVARQSGIG